MEAFYGVLRAGSIFSYSRSFTDRIWTMRAQSVDVHSLSIRPRRTDRNFQLKQRSWSFFDCCMATNSGPSSWNSFLQRTQTGQNGNISWLCRLCNAWLAWLPVVTVEWPFDQLIFCIWSSQVGAGKRLYETCRDLDRYHPISSDIYINIHLVENVYMGSMGFQFRDLPGLHLWHIQYMFCSKFCSNGIEAEAMPTRESRDLGVNALV